MRRIEDVLGSRLADIADQDLLRTLRRVDSAQGTVVSINGRELINFSSNDYLGLANHPATKEAAAKAIHDHGAGSGASRLICGSLKVFHELEETLAGLKQTEACLTFSTGYAAAVGTITSLIGKDDIVIIDKLVHACIVDAVRLSGAKLRIFKHNDLNDLERILKWSGEKGRGSRSKAQNILVITESVFSMDGDVAPLKEIVELKANYGAWLMVDEAHATGMFGGRRSGLVEQCGVSGRVEIQMGTLGKAVGASGGFICGSRKLIDLLINSARSFIFSTAPVPAAAGAALAGVQLIRLNEGRERCERVWENARQCRTGVPPVPNTQGTSEHDLPPRNPQTSGAANLTSKDRQDACPTSPIIPIRIGDEAEAVRVSNELREAGFLVPAIRYPTVARGSARLRITLSADHTSDQIDALATALNEIINQKS